MPLVVRERIVEEILDLLVAPVSDFPWIHENGNLRSRKGFYTALAGA